MFRSDRQCTAANVSRLEGTLYIQWREQHGVKKHRVGGWGRGAGASKGGEGRVATWVADQGNAFQHADGSDDQSKVGRNLEGEVERNLSQVSSKIPANTHSNSLRTPQQTGQLHTAAD